MADLTAFGAVDVPTPADSGNLRRYIIDCSHATTQVDLSRRREEDHIVLALLLDQHRHAIRETEHEVCVCEPTEQQTALMGREA